MKKSSQLNKQGGFTLIELVVAMAIATIVMAAVAGIFTITIKTYNNSTQQADAQNLAAMTARKIEQEVRVCANLNIYTNKVDSPSGTEIYYDDTKQGIYIGSSTSNSTYLAGTFDKYGCKLDFKGTGTALLNVTVTITDGGGKTISSVNTSVYLVNGTKISGTDDGSVIVFS